MGVDQRSKNQVAIKVERQQVEEVSSLDREVFIKDYYRLFSSTHYKVFRKFQGFIGKEKKTIALFW